MNIVNQVLVLFLLMLAGFISAKLKLAGRDMAAHFSKVIINLSLPAMIAASFQRPFSAELLGEAGITLVVSLGVYGAAFGLAAFYPRLLRMEGPERGVHRYGLIFSNCAFIGYPMVEAILGPEWIFHAVIYNIPFNFLAYSLGAWFISKEGERGPAGARPQGAQPRGALVSWKTFVNPSVIASLLGFLLFILSINLPGPLYRSLRMLGDITTPLSMLVIGITLAQTKIRQVFGRRRIYLTVGMRLLLIPALVAGACRFAGVPNPILIVITLLAAMPVGSTTSILSNLYNAAPEEGSSLVFLSTLLCIVTVPLVMFVLGRF